MQGGQIHECAPGGPSRAEAATEFAPTQRPGSAAPGFVPFQRSARELKLSSMELKI